MDKYVYFVIARVKFAYDDESDEEGDLTNDLKMVLSFREQPTTVDEFEDAVIREFAEWQGVELADIKDVFAYAQIELINKL